MIGNTQRYSGGHPAYPTQQHQLSQDGDVAQYAERQMGFSKKHFNAFAAHIAQLHDAGKHEHAEAIRDMVLKLNDNPRFDVNRFDTASKRPEQ